MQTCPVFALKGDIFIILDKSVNKSALCFRDNISIFPGCLLSKHPSKDSPGKDLSITLLMRQTETWKTHGEIWPNNVKKATQIALKETLNYDKFIITVKKYYKTFIAISAWYYTYNSFQCLDWEAILYMTSLKLGSRILINQDQTTVSLGVLQSSRTSSTSFLCDSSILSLPSASVLLYLALYHIVYSWIKGFVACGELWGSYE